MSKLNFFSVDVFILNVFFEQHKNLYVMHGQFKHYMQSLFPNMEKLMSFFSSFQKLEEMSKSSRRKLIVRKVCFQVVFCLQCVHQFFLSCLISLNLRTSPIQSISQFQKQRGIQNTRLFWITLCDLVCYTAVFTGCPPKVRSSNFKL